MFKKIHNIHFVGIGGMGVSALAKLACDEGLSVTGSDLSRNITTEALELRGAVISYGEHASENVPDSAEVLVYSRAIEEKNLERIFAEKNGIPTFSYPEYIGKITQEKKVIAVSGTHGKTTTTGLIGKLLIDAGLDPTVIVGSYISDFNGNARLGKGDYIVLEADEYRNAFSNYNPFISIVTTIDFDHPDYFKDVSDVKDHFTAFLARTSVQGAVIGNILDENIQEVFPVVRHPNCITYGHSLGDIQYSQFHVEEISVCDMKGFILDIKGIRIGIPGEHNVQNATAAFAVAEFLKIPEDTIRKTFLEYRGPWRRFEVKGVVNEIVVVDDYAHHPKEIEVTIQAARDRYTDRKIIAVFQPHHQERTKALFSAFSDALSLADEAILTDMYRVPGRKTDTELDISKMAQDIEKLDTKAYYTHELTGIPLAVQQRARKGDIVLVMGAGNINTITQEILSALQ